METKHKVSLFLVSILLGSMLTVQFTTVHRPRIDNKVVDNVQMNAELTQEKDRQKFYYSEIDRLEQQIKTYENKQGNREELVKAMAEDLDKVKLLAGVKAVKGNGIIITIEDSFDAVAAGGDPSKAASLDYYLYQLINYLNGNEAQAVAVENHRIVSVSSIRSISQNNLQVNAVMIDPRKISIKAVGNIEQMKIGMNLFPQFFREMGKDFKVTDVTNGSLIIPAYESTVDFKYAQPEGDKKL
ncbi:DUF881 domain-containing protein [Tumebacillus permanentifrigoris]|uniref:Uncharacterized protein YlxW (UPF0749 family) n=1 Tax=Tumebacillus permanentifrigoris TaxID=378543 RepID=A0A316D7J5_9BACL|nr:DUF881 domain-containing protein [Tumebacillus permanentifrigoris]PWK11637.1 uncharacterized protein YlxW (UPF0749 family) [Tumebacillus permanentifrigoris]